MAERLALDGGRPVRATMLPYGRQTIDQQDVDAVAAVLRGDWLTTGPHVVEFERRVAEAVGAPHAVAVSSGTAALHAALEAVGVGPGDEVIVPALTFVATANAAVFLGATPVLADVEPDTLLLDPAAVARLVTPRTKAVVPVDFAGQACDYEALRDAVGPGVAIVGDACHALGARRGGRPVGTLADLTCFSFHPVKHVTTGEGGAVTTADDALQRRVRRFRNHGIATDHRQRTLAGTWEYDMEALGFNLRLTDLQAALGTSQLRRLPQWLERRRAIAKRYDRAFAASEAFRPLANRTGDGHAHHLYVVQVDPARLRGGREAAYRALRAENIGVNVHYKPVHLHSFYQRAFGMKPGLAPVAERAGERVLSLPMFHGMTDADAEDVVGAVEKVEAALA